MTIPKRSDAPRQSGRTIWYATILLLGVVVLGYGYYRSSTIALYAGAIITLAGVLTGIVSLVMSKDREGFRDS